METHSLPPSKEEMALRQIKMYPGGNIDESGNSDHIVVYPAGKPEPISNIKTVYKSYSQLLMLHGNTKRTPIIMWIWFSDFSTDWQFLPIYIIIDTLHG